jgi:hypothetical protein
LCVGCSGCTTGNGGNGGSVALVMDVVNIAALNVLVGFCDYFTGLFAAESLSWHPWLVAIHGLGSNS